MIEAHIKYVAGSTPVGGLNAMISENIRRFIGMDEVGKLAKWCEENGHELILKPVYPATAEEIAQEIEQRKASGMWKP